MAMLSGMHNSAVNRLKFTKEEVPPKENQIYAELCHLTNRDQAFKNYREALANTTPPAIPYLGIFSYCIILFSFTQNNKKVLF